MLGKSNQLFCRLCTFLSIESLVIGRYRSLTVVKKRYFLPLAVFFNLMVKRGFCNMVPVKYQVFLAVVSYRHQATSCRRSSDVL